VYRIVDWDVEKVLVFGRLGGVLEGWTTAYKVKKKKKGHLARAYIPKGLSSYAQGDIVIDTR